MKERNKIEVSKILIFYCLIFCSLGSCQRSNYDNEFIDNYGDENFDGYLNTLVYFRSLDENGNLIYFISSLSDTCEAPYIVTINRETKKPTEIDAKLRKPPCDKINADTAAIKNLVERFLKYHVSFLKVDKDSVVFVNVEHAEEANLIRLPKSIPRERIKGFKNVKNNWYSKK